MRIHLKIYSGNNIIPFNHQHLLVGTIHKWLGWNELHGNVALFSFSRLEKGKNTKDGLKLGKYSSLFFSAHDKEIIKSLIRGIQNDPEMFNSLMVSEIILEEDPDLSNRDYFYMASPVLVKRKEGERTRHFLFSEPESDTWLKETLLTKMKLAGLEDDTLEIQFDRENPRATTKLINYKEIKNRANWCSVIIKGKPETKLFAWNVGIGNSTGIGFGAIK